MRNKPPKQRGDRKDAYLVRNPDPMHVLMARVLDNRTANEAVMSDQIDLTAAEAYLARRNAENPQYKFTLFHLVVAAFAKTVALRPKMNRFFQNNRLYERENITFAFVVKNKFADNAGESLVIMKVDESDGAASPMDQAHDYICSQTYKVRHEVEGADGTTDFMSKLTSLPGFVLSAAVGVIRFLDRRGRLPEAISSISPYNSTVFISNLGSIKMSADYHHLANFGTNSIFVIIGEKKLTPYYQTDGSMEMHMALELGITIDERIADGFYFAKSVKLLNHILIHPELLEQPLYEPVEWEE